MYIISSLTNRLLRKEFRDETVIADLTTEMNRDAAFEEEDITAYLLRRNFTTAMVSVCGMEEDELQYLMGHDILDEQEMRSDFTDADFLARLWHKMNRRVLRDNIPENDMYLVIDRADAWWKDAAKFVLKSRSPALQTPVILRSWMYGMNCRGIIFRFGPTGMRQLLRKILR